MSHTKGPWFILLRPHTTEAVAKGIRYLSVGDDTGPLHIVDAQERPIAAVVHRNGGGEGFSETACNARLIENAPELLTKAAALVGRIRENSGQHPSPVFKRQLDELEALLQSIEGKKLVSSV